MIFETLPYLQLGESCGNLFILLTMPNNMLLIIYCSSYTIFSITTLALGWAAVFCVVMYTTISPSYSDESIFITITLQSTDVITNWRPPCVSRVPVLITIRVAALRSVTPFLLKQLANTFLWSF